MGSLVAELAEKLSSATNNFDIDEGTIYVNTSADTVAIGGTSPDGKFSIHQSASADILNLYDGTDVVFSVLDGGNVGIGTTAPLGLLGLYKSGANADMVIHNLKSASGSRYISAINLLSQNSDNYASWSTWTSTDSAPSFNISYDADADSIGTTPYLTITDAGKVGIGTTAPQSFLQVNGTSSGAGEISITRVDTSQTLVSGSALGYIFFGAQDSDSTLDKDATQIVSHCEEAWTSSAHGSRLQFFTTTSGTTTATEKMRITNDGKVGIGTTAPTGLLTIRGSADNADLQALTLTNTDWASGETSQSVSIQFLINRTGTTDAAAGKILAGKDNHYNDTAAVDSHLAFYTAVNDSQTERMRINSAGYVGIGTSSPQGVLTINRSDFSSYGDAVTNPTGQALSIAGDYTNSRYTGIYSVYTPSNNATKTKFAHWLVTDTSLGTTANWSTTSSYSNGVTRNDLVIRYDGNVGIGQSNPTTKLHVTDATTSGNYVAAFYNTTDIAGAFGIWIQCGHQSGTGTTYFLRAVESDGGVTGGLKTENGTFSVFDDSDERLKKNIRDTSIKGLDTVLAMKVRDFEWKKNDFTVEAGFIAQEMKKAFEPASPNDEDAVDDKGNPIMMGVSRERIVPVLVKSIQELSAKNDALEAKVKALESA